MWKVEKTPCYPNCYKVTADLPVISSNASCNYFPTVESAKQEADQRNEKLSGRRGCVPKGPCDNHIAEIEDLTRQLAEARDEIERLKNAYIDRSNELLAQRDELRNELRNGLELTITAKNNYIDEIAQLRKALNEIVDNIAADKPSCTYCHHTVRVAIAALEANDG